MPGEINFSYDPLTGAPTFSVSPTELIRNLFTGKAPDSEKEFANVYSYLKENRLQMTDMAINYYNNNPKLSSCTSPIKGVKLLGLPTFIPAADPIDLQLGACPEIKLTSRIEQPIRNSLFYSASYLPWSYRYVENVELLNRKFVEQYNPPDTLKPRLFNAPIYQLVEFSNSNGQLEFICCRNDYFTYMDTCELLFYDFARVIWEKFISKGQNPDATKIKARNLKCKGDISLLEYSNRCVGIGVNSIFLMKDRTDVTFFKHKRTPGATMEAINMEHVVPAGTFQPRRGIPDTPDLDFNIYKNILRELGEELLGKEEMEQIKISPDDITDDYHIAAYHSLFVQGYAKAFFLGWGIDPLTTKAEFLTAVVVNMGEFKKRFGEPKFEHNWEGLQYSFRFNESVVREFVNGPYTLPAGAGCAQLAWENKDYLIESIR